MMAKYQNKKVTKLIGHRVRRIRVAKNLEVEDIATQTGFHRNTIHSIEKGANTDISHLIEIAFAMNIHPKDLLDIQFSIKPRYPLSATRKEKNRLTSRIQGLIKQGYFKTERTSLEVCNQLQKNFPQSNNFQTKNISVILTRLAEQGKLKIRKAKRKNYYVKK